MPLATREGLLGSLGQIERVQLGEESYVYVKPMSAAQIEAITKKQGSNYDQIARVVVACTCDENGDLLFSKTDVSKIKEGMSPAYQITIAEKANEISGGTLVDEEAMEEAEKNSGTGVSCDLSMS